ncbi:MAG: BON domain-containing protein [Pseudomonadota bacterium]|nr:BON domain-containing protein [Pseudomonadota bacterium]
MKDSLFIHSRKALLAMGLVSALSLAACSGDDRAGQMSDDMAADAPKESENLGAAVSDTGITAKVKARLASDQRTQGKGVSVQTNNGVVTLSGQVATVDVSEAAEELARNVPDVKGIDNRIQAPSTIDELGDRAENAADQAGTAMSDAMITTKVKAKLAADDMVKAMDIDVDTESAEVSLSGTVASDTVRDRAVELAESVDGVASVDADGLMVK